MNGILNKLTAAIVTVSMLICAPICTAANSGTAASAAASNAVAAKYNATTEPKEDAYPESEHNYSGSVDEWMSYTSPDNNAKALTIGFSALSKLETGDSVKVYDAGDNLVKEYHGDEISGAELKVNGNSFKIHMSGYGYGDCYGFSIASVTASSETVPMTDLYINYIEMYGYAIGNTGNVNCYYSPQNTTEYIKWSSSDESVATVKGGVITVTGYGGTVITAESSDGSCSCTYDMFVDPPSYVSAENLKLNVGESYKLENVYTVKPSYIDWYSALQRLTATERFMQFPPVTPIYPAPQLTPHAMLP